MEYDIQRACWRLMRSGSERSALAKVRISRERFLNEMGYALDGVHLPLSVFGAFVCVGVKRLSGANVTTKSRVDSRASKA